MRTLTHQQRDSAEHDAGIRKALIAEAASRCGMLLRADSNETAMLDRSLRFIEAELIRAEYPTRKFRHFLPINNSAPPGAQTIVWRESNVVGRAKEITNYADDLPMVDVSRAENINRICAFGSAFQYSLEDLQRAAASFQLDPGGGFPLDAERADTCREMIELKLDEVASVGQANVQIQGFLNNSAVTVMTAATVSANTKWCTIAGVPLKSSADIIADVNAMLIKVPVDTLELHAVNRMVFPTQLFTLISTMPYSTLSDTTVLQWLRMNHPEVTFESWTRLNFANATSDAGRILAYEYDRRVADCVIPQEYQQVPPQARNLAFVVNAWAKTAGVRVRRPKAVLYMDGANGTT